MRLRVELAAALRWADRLNFSEGICNHFSVTSQKGFLINPIGIHWKEIRPSQLVEITKDNHDTDEVEITAMKIHMAIHNHDHNKAAVLHTHMPFATTLACIHTELKFIHQNSLRFYDRICYDWNYSGLALDEKEGERIAKKLGKQDILFLGNHGVIVCGNTIAQAFDDLYYLERVCELQIKAMSTGQKLSIINEEVSRLTSKQFIQEGPKQAELHLRALIRILDEETDSAWRND